MVSDNVSQFLSRCMKLHEICDDLFTEMLDGLIALPYIRMAEAGLAWSELGLVIHNLLLTLRFIHCICMQLH